MACQTLPLIAPSSAPLDVVDIDAPSRHGENDDDALTPATLSSRGQSHAAKMSPFWAIFDCILQDFFCPARNPGGVVNMGIANNSLMEAELLALAASPHNRLEPYDLTYGTSLFGSTRLFAALAGHFNTYFHPHTPVQAEHMITGPGCGSLLDQISTHLLDDGDAFLCAAPYYNGFPADAEPRANVRVVGVRSPYGKGDGTEPEWYQGESALAGFEEALLAERGRIKAVLLCTPHNPVGRCYDRAALVAYGRFCQKHDLHLVSDEIYALSTFPTSDEAQPQPFVSALSIDWAAEGVHPSRISVLYSASKDTGLNGIRLGVLVAQHHPALLAAMKVTAKLNMVGSPSDALFSALLTHSTFFPRFVATNRARLSTAYESIKAWLVHHRIDYTPSNAGHFVLVDLSPFVPAEDKDGNAIVDPRDKDTLLWARALELKVAITPASNYAHPRPGIFRLTFSLLPHALLEGLRRLEAVLGLEDNPWTPPMEASAAGCATQTLVPFGLQTAEDVQTGWALLERVLREGVSNPATSTTTTTIAAVTTSAPTVPSTVPTSVQEAILGHAPANTPTRKRARRYTTSEALDALPALSLAQLKALSKAASSCCC